MEGFRYKDNSELEEQASKVSADLGEEIVPSSIKKEKLARISLEEIKAKYPERYDIYLSLVRKQKNNLEIDEKEVEEMSLWIKALNNLDAYIKGHAPSLHEKDPREKRQFTVFEDIRDSLERGEKEGYVKLPTGVGKTVLFSQVVESLGLKSLIVVPSKILVGQTGERLEEFTDIDFGKYFQEVKDYSKPVTITTYPSLIRGLQSGRIKPEEYGALILDEVHKALGPKSVEAIARFDCVKLGFTATPEYSSKKHVRDVLGHEIHSMSIIEAVQEGLISRFRSYVAYTETDFSMVKIKNMSSYDEKDLEHTINNKQRNLSAVQLYKEQFSGKQAIAYCGGVAHAKDLADLFNEHGVEAEIISGSTSKEDKDKILEKYMSGELKVLCNARLLIEGFDAPQASVCLNLHPTLSKVSAEQRAGRVLRLDSNDLDKWAFIVDFVDRNAKIPPVTFPEIANASEASEDLIVNSEDEDENIEDEVNPSFGRKRQYIENLEINNLNVVVDAREVLRITRTFEKQRYQEKWLTYDELQEEVRKTGIESSTQYKKESHKHSNWPGHPDDVYKEKWTGWPDFLGKEKKIFIPFDTFVAEVRAVGIKSEIQYLKNYKSHSGWPSRPADTYNDHWNGWHEIFGTEKRKGKEFLSYSDIQAKIKEANIIDQRHYGSEYKKHKGWPSRPDQSYKTEWKGWDDFLGREDPYLSFEDLISEVSSANINSKEEYERKSKENPKWPFAVPTVYRDKWKGWPEFFGREKKNFMPYQELREKLLELGIITETQYRKERRNYPNWPSNPDSTYSKEWIDWPTFFSRKPMR